MEPGPVCVPRTLSILRALDLTFTSTSYLAQARADVALELQRTRDEVNEMMKQARAEAAQILLAAATELNQVRFVLHFCDRHIGPTEIVQARQRHILGLLGVDGCSNVLRCSDTLSQAHNPEFKTQNLEQARAEATLARADAQEVLAQARRDAKAGN